MASPGGAYGHVQWNNGGGTFGGHNVFWYNGSLHVAMTNDVGVQYKIQSGDSIYARKDMYVGQDLTVRRQIKSGNIVSGQIFPLWEQLSGAWTMVNKTAADFRTALGVYGKGDTYSRSEMDNRYLAASQITNYYTKSETYGIADLYTKSQVYTKAEVTALLASYCTIAEVNSTLEDYARTTHYHTVTISPAGAHTHGGEVTEEADHTHSVASVSQSI